MPGDLCYGVFIERLFCGFWAFRGWRQDLCILRRNIYLISTKGGFSSVNSLVKHISILLLSPHLDRLIITSTNHGLSIGAQCNTRNSVCMAGESVYFLASGEDSIP